MPNIKSTIGQVALLTIGAILMLSGSYFAGLVPLMAAVLWAGYWAF